MRPSGSPTAWPEALSSVRGALVHKRCQVGVSPSSMALPSRPGRNPQPSRTMRTTGVRCPRGFAILKEMQSSQALRALPVVLCLAPPLVPHPCLAQARLRATGEEWFYQQPGGKRLARILAGTALVGGTTQGDWQAVTLDGWIFLASVGRAPGETLRATPGGALLAKLPQGFAPGGMGGEGRGEGGGGGGGGEGGR